MPDSEKPAKKAAKKPAKKAAVKKAATKTAREKPPVAPPLTPEEAPALLDEEERAALASARAEVDEVLAMGATLLVGESVTVELVMHVDRPDTPQEAVDRAITALSHQGSDSFYFVVTDPGTTPPSKYLVRAGQVLDPEVMMEQFGDEYPTSG